MCRCAKAERSSGTGAPGPGRVATACPFVDSGFAFGLLGPVRARFGWRCGMARPLLEFPRMGLRDRAELEARLRFSLCARLRAARQRTDSLFALLPDEALRERPVPERHRLIFYLGHLEAFDSNLILRDSLGRASRRPELDRLFAFGIDPLATDLPSDQPSDWPHLVDVRRYNACQRVAVDAAIATTPSPRPVHPNLQNGWAVEPRDRAPADARRDARLPDPPAALRPEAAPVRTLRFRRSRRAHADWSRSRPGERTLGLARRVAPFGLGQRVRSPRRGRRGVRDRVATT